MEITSIFAFNPKLRHYAGLQKEYTVSFKENPLKRDTFILSQNNKKNKLKNEKNSEEKNIKNDNKNNDKNKKKEESDEYINSSLYWDLKYNNLLWRLFAYKCKAQIIYLIILFALLYKNIIAKLLGNA